MYLLHIMLDITKANDLQDPAGLNSLEGTQLGSRLQAPPHPKRAHKTWVNNLWDPAGVKINK